MEWFRGTAVVFELDLRFLKEEPLKQINEKSITPCLGISVPQVWGFAMLPAISPLPRPCLALGMCLLNTCCQGVMNEIK